MHTVIHWFRRDLRISDNVSLHEAFTRGECLVPVFILDDAILQAPDSGTARVAFLLPVLESLRRNLEALGHRLILLHGTPHEELVKLARTIRADAVFTNRDYEPYAIARDRKVAGALYEAGVYFESFKDSVIWEGRDVLTKANEPYTVFTPYAKAWRAKPIAPPVPKLGRAKTPVPESAHSLPLPKDSAQLGHRWPQPRPEEMGASGTGFQPVSRASSPGAGFSGAGSPSDRQDACPTIQAGSPALPPAGEHAALEALKQFLAQRVYDYDRARDFPADEGGTSRLSPHLRFGTVGIRTVLAKLFAAREVATPAQDRACVVWETELIWREFYQQILANFPHVAEGSFRREYDQLQWSGTDAQFAAWCAGQTGFPIVDAAMRCLNATGWMHNRLRMIVAMFLTKDLLISWQRGERYFMQQLVDGELAANNGGWQWSAGCGTDAAPYFRIFNPVSQGAKFDPQGAFVRRWVPELRDAPDELIHQPWEDPLLLSRTKYPAPIVDHAKQRLKCLAMFKAVKAAADDAD
jgi:deoxyribodipyrimidine photo-lyase